MPKVTSLNARTAAQASASEVVPIALITITHEDLDEPVRLSTDPTKRLSDDPLRYGTIHQGEIYYYALISVPMPEQGQDAADTVAMTIDIVTPELSRIPTLVTSPATVDIVQVMSSTPDVIEFEWRGLETRSAEVDTDQGLITIEIGRMPRLDEPTQLHRMTAHRFPGLHRR